MTNVVIVCPIFLVGATSFVTGGIIGSGIFITANSILLAVGSWGLALLVWLVSGLLALAGGLCWAELATVFPRQGGTYIFIKDGLGDTPSFVYIIIRYVSYIIYQQAPTALSKSLSLSLSSFLQLRFLSKSSL